MLLMDTHLHTNASEDSDAPITAMCDAAVARGLSAIAITDHVEMVGYREMGYDETLRQSWRESGEQVPAYAGRLRIARGMELGEPLYNLTDAEQILDTHAFDFVLGSLHKLEDEVDFYFYDYTGVDVGAIMDRYFGEVYELIRWGRFHSLAHLTYPFRYLPESRRPADYSRWQEAIDRLMRLLAEKGLALEINTSGLRSPAIHCASPDLPLVKRFRELGGELITVGSDAHHPADVGAGIPEALAMAREAGFRYVTAFFEGKPECFPLDR